MQSEVHLIVTKTQTLTLNSVSDTAIYGNVGSWRLIIDSFPQQLELIGKTVTLVNSNGDTQACTILSQVIDSPNPGETRLNFDNSNPFNFDFRAAAGGYFLYDIVTESYLDLFENESISQNWKFQDLTNFTSQGAFTREFRIPFSTTNQNALGPLFDVNISSGTSNFFHYKLPAEIRVDTLPISSGYLRVRKVYKQSNRISEVEVAFYAETPDLVRNIGEKKLKDITDLPNLNQNMSYDNIVAENIPGVWTLLERGQLWSANGQVNTRPLTDETKPVWAGDFTPALRWDYLFQQIFLDAGFELVAGTLLSALNNYHMPWLNSKRPVASDSFNDNFWRAYNSADLNFAMAPTVIPIDTEIFDNGGDFDPTTYTYTTPVDGYYTFRLVCRVSSPSGQYVFLKLLVDGVEIFIDNFFINPGPTPQIIDTQFRGGINAASSVQFLISSQEPTFCKLWAGDGTYNSSLFEVVKTEFNFGQMFFFDLNAPDVKQLDFVTDVIKMHNCAIVPDRTIPNKIYIVPQNSYLGSGAVLDWTSKLDISKDITLSSTVDLQKGKFQFTYSEGQDYLSKQYKNVNRIYGDYEAVGYTINPNTLPSDFAIGDQKIQLVTQSTPCGVIDGTNVVMPMFINENGQFVVPGMRCLYMAGYCDIKMFDDSTVAVVDYQAKLLNHYSTIVPDIFDADLNWAPETPPYGIISNPYFNLFNLYWRTYMNALYSPDARIMEAHFALDLKDILTFQFSDKVWIQDSFWRILEVTDYKVGDYESTKVKLLKFLEDVEDCAGTPVSVSANGEVNFENASGDPVEATQDCCQRYGYNWDEETATCWAFTPDGTRPTSGISGTTTSPAPRPSETELQTRSVLNSVVNGENINIASGNFDMVAVGRDLELNKLVYGSNLLGKNVTTNLPGIHLGGGYRNGVITTAETGWSQSGIVHLHNKDAFASAGAKRALFIEGINGEHLDIPDATTWSCMLNVTIQEETQTDIDIALLSFGLTKISGTAYATPVTVISSDTFGTGFTYDIDIDVTTNTAEHRLVLTINGALSFPVTIIATATLYYQQNKLA